MEISDVLNVEKLVKLDIKEQIRFLESDLEKIKETKKPLGIVSWDDYKEDKKEVKRMLKAFRIVGEYYGVNI